MNAPDAANTIFTLMQKLGAPTSLEEIGMKRADLPRAASLVMELPYYNPRPVTYDGVLALLDDAFVGCLGGVAREGRLANN
jgi:alcohol dehydrogenase class IV